MDTATAIVRRGLVAGLVRSEAINREQFDEISRQIAIAGAGTGNDGEVNRFISDLHEHLRLDDPNA